MHKRGFTLIEILIALAIFAFLIMLAGPIYTEFMANSQIRNRAESALDGVRLAQNEAIKRNTQVQFVLLSTGWQVSWLNDETAAFEVLQSYNLREGASMTTATPSTGKVTFNGMGRVMYPNPDDASAPITRIEVTNSHVSSSRKLDIVINSLASTTTGIKLCDPDPAVASLDPPDPRACPAA
jgi:type IV fimbrial biogenesis protein FimT